MTLDQFRISAKKVHGDKYSYDKTVYVNTKTKVIITCPTHGNFLQSPNMHVSGARGCKKCFSEKITLTLPEFISKARSVHGESYNYIEYVAARVNIDISCEVHGIFSQNPNQHLQGAGCPKCADLSRISKRVITYDKFLERARELHGDFFSYPPYIEDFNVKERLTIVCPEHGSFTPKGITHLTSSCKKCASEKLPGGYNLKTIQRGGVALENKKCSLYLIHLPHLGTDVYKIGISTSLESRMQSLTAASKGKPVVVDEYKSTLLKCFNLEQDLHKLFAGTRYRKTKFAGHTETFHLTSEDLELLDLIFTELQELGDTPRHRVAA